MTDRRQNLKDSTLYRWMQHITLWLDQYYLDAIAGLVPGGIGDVFSSLFSLVHVYFAAFRLRSLPLTLAILNNCLRDLFLGLLPFYVGNVIDFFHRANKQNMALIDGFINNDRDIIRAVNRKAVYSGIIVLTFVAAIILLVKLLLRLTDALGSVLFS